MQYNHILLGINLIGRIVSHFITSRISENMSIFLLQHNYVRGPRVYILTGKTNTIVWGILIDWPFKSIFNNYLYFDDLIHLVSIQIVILLEDGIQLRVIAIYGVRLKEQFCEILAKDPDNYSNVLIYLFMDENDIGNDIIQVNLFQIEFTGLRTAVNQARG